MQGRTAGREVAEVSVRIGGTLAIPAVLRSLGVADAHEARHGGGFPEQARAIIDSSSGPAGDIVANLIVRNLDDALVDALKLRAARNRRSAEAEHREILANALRRPRKRGLAEVLAAIPGVGKDDDFARIEDAAEAQRVPD